MKRAVVDANVAVKWVLDEPFLTEALRVYATHELIAPSLVHAEVASALSKAVARREMTAEEGSRKMWEVVAADIETVPDELLAPEAVALADRLQHSVYDCFYLALAMAEAAPLVTADREFVSVARTGGLGEHVLWIGDVK